MKNNKLKVGISVGDPNGIGVEMILKTFQNKEILEFFTPVIFGSTKLLSYQKNVFNLNSLNFQGIFKPEEAVHGKMNVVNLWKDNVNIEFGKITKEGLDIARISLTASLEALEKGLIDVLVMSPLSEEVFKADNFKYKSQYDYLESRFQSRSLIMIQNEELRVALATHDIPTSEVSSKLTKEALKRQIRLLNNTLIENFGIERPKIAVLDLDNQTEGEGKQGSNKAFQNVIEENFNKGLLSFGPYSFTDFSTFDFSAFDAVLATDYDQGIRPFNAQKGVAFVSGLPFIITAPVQEPDYEIAGKGIADYTVFEQAIFDAIKIYKTHKEYKYLKKNALQKINIEDIDSSVDEDLPEDGND